MTEEPIRVFVVDDHEVVRLGLRAFLGATPGVELIGEAGDGRAALTELAERAQGTMFGLYDMFSGNNLSQMTIFALGIMPYISASIILQLLTVVWPYLERLSKEGDLGRRKITQYTRYGTMLSAMRSEFATYRRTASRRDDAVTSW